MQYTEVMDWICWCNNTALLAVAVKRRCEVPVAKESSGKGQLTIPSHDLPEVDMVGGIIHILV